MNPANSVLLITWIERSPLNCGPGDHHDRRHGGHADGWRCREGADPASGGTSLHIHRLWPLAAVAVICACQKPDVITNLESGNNVHMIVMPIPVACA